MNYLAILVCFAMLLAGCMSSKPLYLKLAAHPSTISCANVQVRDARIYRGDVGAVGPHVIHATHVIEWMRKRFSSALPGACTDKQMKIQFTLHQFYVVSSADTLLAVIDGTANIKKHGNTRWSKKIHVQVQNSNWDDNPVVMSANLNKAMSKLIAVFASASKKVERS